MSVIWINILACGYVLLQGPIIKTTTSSAISAIEANFLRDDLSGGERDQIKALTIRIIQNQTAAMSSFWHATIGALFIGLLLLIQNLVILAILRRQKRAEQDEDTKPDNAPS